MRKILIVFICFCVVFPVFGQADYTNFTRADYFAFDPRNTSNPTFFLFQSMNVLRNNILPLAVYPSQKEIDEQGFLISTNGFFPELEMYIRQYRLKGKWELVTSWNGDKNKMNTLFQGILSYLSQNTGGSWAGRAFNTSPIEYVGVNNKNNTLTYTYNITAYPGLFNNPHMDLAEVWQVDLSLSTNNEVTLKVSYLHNLPIQTR